MIFIYNTLLLTVEWSKCQTWVIERYSAIIKTTILAPFRWTRQQAADNLGISKRHMHRLVRYFREKGIPGLRLKSKEPKSSPNKSPKPVEKAVVSMKKLTGFGNDSISDLVNEQFRLEGFDKRITPILAYRISLRNNLQQITEKIRPKFKHFDWKCRPSGHLSPPTIKYPRRQSRGGDIRCLT